MPAPPAAVGPLAPAGGGRIHRWLRGHVLSTFHALTDFHHLRRHGQPVPRLSRNQHLAQRLDLLAELYQRDDAGAMLLAPEEDPLPEDVHGDHPLGAARGGDRLALLGEAPPGGDVELVLVLETAEEPPAAARDLAGIE